METPEVEIRFSHEFVNGSGKVRITVNAMKDIFTDEFKITSERDRGRFAVKVVDRFAALDEAAVHEKLKDIQRDFSVYRERQRDDEREGVEPDDSQAGQLVALAVKDLGVELFHPPGTAACSPFARVPVGCHFEHLPVHGKSFRLWISKEYFSRFQRVPNQSALADAINTLAGMAVFSGSEHAVCVRLGGDDTTIYLDLGRTDFQIVTITAEGWEIVPGSDCPIRFLRREGELEMPLPVRGGSIALLRPFLNVSDEETWALVAAFVVGCFRPDGPYPILVVNGEQGSAKSTLCRFLRRLIDPNLVPLRRPPRDERDLFIAAMNARLLAFDNLSGLPRALADSLCSIATGGGNSTRRLFSDDEETLFECTRPIVVNGIEDLATREDVLDRALVINLQPISETDRREERELERLLRVALPEVLGGVLDAVAMAIRRLPTLRAPRLPRMADFGKWALAAEPALPLTEGAFARAMLDNQANVHADVLASSSLGCAVVAFIERRGQFEGPATQLLVELNRIRGTDPTLLADWPKSPSALAATLARLAPCLRANGIHVVTGRRKPGNSRERYLTIAKLKPEVRGV